MGEITVKSGAKTQVTFSVRSRCYRIQESDTPIVLFYAYLAIILQQTHNTSTLVITLPHFAG